MNHGNSFCQSFDLIAHVKQFTIENEKQKSPIGDKITNWWFVLGIDIFRIGDWGFPESWKHQFKIQNHQLVILSPIGDFHFYFFIDFYAPFPSKMADFCTLRISTVTGKVSLRLKRQWMNNWVNEWISDIGVCRTAPATQGLLITSRRREALCYHTLLMKLHHWIKFPNFHYHKFLITNFY